MTVKLADYEVEFEQGDLVHVKKQKPNKTYRKAQEAEVLAVNERTFTVQYTTNQVRETFTKGELVTGEIAIEPTNPRPKPEPKKEKDQPKPKKDPPKKGDPSKKPGKISKRESWQMAQAVHEGAVISELAKKFDCSWPTIKHHYEKHKDQLGAGNGPEQEFQKRVEEFDLALGLEENEKKMQQEYKAKIEEKTKSRQDEICGECLAEVVCKFKDQLHTLPEWATCRFKYNEFQKIRLTGGNHQTNRTI